MTSRPPKVLFFQRSAGVFMLSSPPKKKKETNIRTGETESEKPSSDTIKLAFQNSDNFFNEQEVLYVFHLERTNIFRVTLITKYHPSSLECEFTIPWSWLWLGHNEARLYRPFTDS